MNLSQRFALLTTTCLLPVTAIPAGATNVENVNMIFSADATYLWSGTYDWPDDPDQGPVTGADFFFNDGTEHTWKLNNGATVILEQTGNQSGGRIFVGSGGDGEITFTSDAGVPGRISARYNAFAAMRIGETPGNHSGTVNIEGGVTFESGWIFGEGSGTRSLNIHDGLFAVFSNNPDRRLNGIDVTIGPNGALWVEDSAADVVDVDSFEAFAAGATLQATDWPLVFTNNQPRNAIVGGTVNGTLITRKSVPTPSCHPLPSAATPPAPPTPAGQGATSSAISPSLPTATSTAWPMIGKSTTSAAWLLPIRSPTPTATDKRTSLSSSPASTRSPRTPPISPSPMTQR